MTFFAHSPIFRDSLENRVLLTCARLKLQDIHRNELASLLSANPDWSYVLEHAVINRIAPLAYAHLNSASGPVPEYVLTDLKRSCQQIKIKNALLLDELSRIIPALASKNIKIMVLKGMALIDMVYRDPALRQMRDIDVLIREKDFEEIRRQLLGLGYNTTAELPNMSGVELVEYSHFFDQIKFKKISGALIDSHFRLLNMGLPQKDESMIWDRAVATNIAGVNVLIPSPEDMLLHLCFHTSQHHYSKISHFCDIHEALNLSYDYDWDYIASVAGSRRIYPSIYHSLLYTGRLLKVNISQDVLDKFKPSYIRRKLFVFTWEKIIIRHRRRLNFGNLQGPVYYLLEMDGLKEKAAFIYKSFFPPLSWLACRFSLPKTKKLYIKYFSTLLMKIFKTANAKSNRNITL